MAAYFFVALISLVAGFGALAALRLKLAAADRWLLAPGACMVAWALVLGIGVSLGMSTRVLAVPFWSLTGVAAIYGIVQARLEWTSRVAGLLVLVLALPVGLMAYDVAHGLANYIGGPASDGWSYVAYGQYLWQWPKGTEGSLAPLYQYAAHLSRTRFVASGLLGVFSPIAGRRGDTQAAVGCFVAWTLFIFGASCAAYGTDRLARRRWLAALCALAVSSRWVYGAIQVHNYDNLIAISFLPLAMAVIRRIAGPDWRSSVTLGAILAAAIYGYPELAAFVAIGAALAVLVRAFHDGRWLAWVGWGAGAAGLAFVLLLPGLSDLRWFISSQIRGATVAVGARPGEGSFAALVSSHDWFSTFWGYEPLSATSRFAKFATAWTLSGHLLAAALWILTGFGIVRFLRRRQWDAVALCGLLMVGEVLMVARQHYSYGAYKFLLLQCWLMAAFVTAGAQTIADWITADGKSRHVLWRWLPGVAGAILACGLAGTVAQRERAFHLTVAAGTIEPYRALLAADRITAREPILVSVDDVIANEWAVYFLRDHPIRLLGYRGYMAMSHVVPLMNRSTPVDLSAARYVLSDDRSSVQRDVVWAGGPYILWRIPASGAAVLGQVDNPNGAERMDGRSFYWIGSADTRVEVVATADGTIALTGRFVPGPSLPVTPERHILLSSPADGEHLFAINRDADQVIPVLVQRGENEITIRDLDQPTAMAPNDPRPLLLGLEGLSVAMASPGMVFTAKPAAPAVISSCSVAFASGWHGAEQSDQGSFRWSGGTGHLIVSSQETAEFELTGEVLSFVRPNRVDVAVNGKRLMTWNIDDPAWAFHLFTPVIFRIEAGQVATLDLASRTKGVVQQTDPRPLAIAVRHLTVRRTDRAAVCRNLAGNGF